jgi:hypothetical protein
MLWDPVRSIWVSSTPEELVRQKLIGQMIQELGYPKGLISVEKWMKSRRFDLVVYTKNVKPLLLVECKAIPITDQAIRQALGYNETIKAPFICIVNQDSIQTFWKQKTTFASVPFLPTYNDLAKHITN